MSQWNSPGTYSHHWLGRTTPPSEVEPGPCPRAAARAGCAVGFHTWGRKRRLEADSEGGAGGRGSGSHSQGGWLGEVEQQGVILERTPEGSARSFHQRFPGRFPHRPLCWMLEQWDESTHPCPGEPQRGRRAGPDKALPTPLRMAREPRPRQLATRSDTGQGPRWCPSLWSSSWVDGDRTTETGNVRQTLKNTVSQERVCVGHAGLEVPVRSPGDSREDQRDGSGDPRGLQAGPEAQALPGCSWF